ncbi:unnamed protein product, partial [Discosporangium mesarthrocarpum]
MVAESTSNDMDVVKPDEAGPDGVPATFESKRFNPTSSKEGTPPSTGVAGRKEKGEGEEEEDLLDKPSKRHKMQNGEERGEDNSRNSASNGASNGTNNGASNSTSNGASNGASNCASSPPPPTPILSPDAANPN